MPREMPIYDDPLKSVRSIEKLKALEGVQVLLSAWDEPRAGSQIERIMAEGQEYLSRIHKAVLKVSDGSTDPIDLSRRVLRELGMPENMANPLVARSFQSNLKYKGVDGLQEGVEKS